jgi:hypothetical protein
MLLASGLKDLAYQVPDPPQKLQGKLNLSGCGRCTSDRACRSRNSSRCKHDQIRRIEICAVQEIEEFGSKLGRPAFADIFVFEH